MACVLCFFKERGDKILKESFAVSALNFPDGGHIPDCIRSDFCFVMEEKGHRYAFLQDLSGKHFKGNLSYKNTRIACG